MDRGAWWAAVHGVAKSSTRLSDFPFTFHFHALEKEMATHSSVLAWRIPGTGEPGGLPSMGSHRVRHDWSNLAVVVAAEYYICIFILSTRRLQSIRDICQPWRYLWDKLLQLCLIPCNPMDYSLPGSSVHGDSAGKILEWVAMPSSRVFSQPKDWTCVFHVSWIGRWFFTTSATSEAHVQHMATLFLLFWGISMLFSIMAVLVYIPTNSLVCK